MLSHVEVNKYISIKLDNNVTYNANCVSTFYSEKPVRSNSSNVTISLNSVMTFASTKK